MDTNIMTKAIQRLFIKNNTTFLEPFFSLSTDQTQLNKIATFTKLSHIYLFILSFGSLQVSLK